MMAYYLLALVMLGWIANFAQLVAGQCDISMFALNSLLTILSTICIGQLEGQK